MKEFQFACSYITVRLVVHATKSTFLAWACRSPRLVEYRLGTRPVVGQVLGGVKGSALAVDTARLSSGLNN